MSSILTNNAATSALSTLRSINNNLGDTQNRISSGMKVSSGKDNAAFFSISESLKSDSGMFNAVNDSLTLTKNSISTARLGAETVVDLVNQFSERVAFAQGGSDSVRASVQNELDELAERITTTISQSTFNGEDLVNGTSAVTVVTGITRSSAGSVGTTTISFNQQDLGAIQSALAAIDLTTSSTTALLAADLTTVTTQLTAATDSATSLGIAEKSIETQQTFLTELTDRIDSGVGSMVDANMEKEAARLQSLQVQQQLASQSLSIANQAPQNILSLFR
ncbi:MAG: flagellar protein [Rhodobacteraceae bacterium]|nr:flagellar protein [Paracoccaceae bacterium]